MLNFLLQKREEVLPGMSNFPEAVSPPGELKHPSKHKPAPRFKRLPTFLVTLVVFNWSLCYQIFYKREKNKRSLSTSSAAVGIREESRRPLAIVRELP